MYVPNMPSVDAKVKARLTSDIALIVPLVWNSTNNLNINETNTQYAIQVFILIFVLHVYTITPLYIYTIVTLHLHCIYCIVNKYKQ